MQSYYNYFKNRMLYRTVLLFSLIASIAFIRYLDQKVLGGLVTQVSKSEPTHSSLRISHEKNAEDSNSHDINPLHPHIAWLMSYPNSGTSFTMNMVSHGSNFTVASNYGAECMINLSSGLNDPLYSSSPNGPYLLNPLKGLPPRYVLTKTHCGSRCVNCNPFSNIETMDYFMHMCSKGGLMQRNTQHVPGELSIDDKRNKYSKPDKVKGFEKVDVVYDPHLAQRAIHLIRDPFNNIVSNFHLDYHRKVKLNSTDWLKKYPNDVNGFKAWCWDRNEVVKAGKDLMLSDVHLIDDMLKLLNKVPCFGTFFLFTQWHNLAIQVIQHLEIPSLVIHYEEYETDFDETVKSVFDFLDLDMVYPADPFIVGKNYSEYFTPAEKEAGMKIIQMLASAETWEIVKRYW